MVSNGMFTCLGDTYLTGIYISSCKSPVYLTSLFLMTIPFIEKAHSVDSYEKDKIIADIRSVLNTCSDVAGAWLFGSFINLESYHDIDVGVLFRKEVPPHVRYTCAGKIGRKIEKVLKPRCHVDIRIMNGAPVSFAHEVTSTGIRIYAGDQSEVVQYETGIIIQYLDIKPMLDYLDREYLKSRKHDPN